MAVISKNNTTNRTLTSTGCWEGAVVPGAADIARWYSASNAGGNFAGSLTVLGLQVDGATADINYTSGTLTLTQTNAFTNGTSNNRRFTFSSTGVMALGVADRTFTLVHTAGGYCIDFAAAGAITGSGIVSIVNGLANGNNANAYFGSTGAHTGFTGTLRFTDGTGIYSGAASSGCFTGANIIIDGPNCILSVGVNGSGIGGAGKTLTVNNNVTLGRSGFLTQINPNVALGSVTRTLTVNGNTIMPGTVTGTAGVTVNLGSASTYLYLSATSSGLSGPCTVNTGRFAVGAPSSSQSTRYAPSALVVNAGSTFEYFGADDFNFPSLASGGAAANPTGTGAIAVAGSHSGTGCTFVAGTLTGFLGLIGTRPISDNAAFTAPRVVVHELPGGFQWVCEATGALTVNARITYAAANAASNSTKLILDSANNTNSAALTGGTYALIVPDTAGAVTLTGTVQRTNTGGIGSARMSLTLGGSNTGDNTLSGNISEVGTNSATLGIAKIEAGRWVLSGNNSHSGPHSISAGVLSAQSNTALGAATSSGVSITGTGTLELRGGITLNKASTSFTFRAGTAATAVQDTSVVSIGDNTLQHGGIVLVANTNLHVSTGNRLALTGGVISGAFAVSKWGNGELDLGSDAHTYSGALSIEDGTLTVANLKAAGTACSLGTGTGNVTIWSDSVTPTILKYVGTENTTTNRTLYFRSGGANHRAGLDASGSGYVWYTSLFESITAGHKLLLQGTSTADNRITADMSGFETIEKNDAGTWSLTNTISVLNAAMTVNAGRLVLSGALSYTTPTTVNGGVLRVQTANRNSTSGTVTVASGGTAELVTNTLASASSSSGEVLGTSSVSVTGGTIKTRGGGAAQMGQVRYGSNLTFGAGSTLHIGAAI